jgi:ABC-type antimicrobial peptide transport system permease subunit
MAATVRRKLSEIEPSRAVFAMQPLEEHLESAYSEDRLRARLLAFFAIAAVSVACIGLYGTLSYTVQRRRREIGVRLALGALHGQIAGQFFRRGMRVAIAGCAAGLALALALGRAVAAMLYGVAPNDALTLSAVVSLVIAVAAVAALMPAVRAAKLQPMHVLREE